MDLVAVLAAATSLAAAATTVILGARFERRRLLEQRDYARRQAADRYAQPLLAAANSLASRIGNATPDQVGELAMVEGDRGERYAAYLRYDTLYRLGRYLCWTHIIYREVRGLDLGDRRRNHELAARMADVGSAMNDRRIAPLFVLLGGEQDAIGELMLEHRDDGEPRCMSYVSFERRMLTGEPDLMRWFGPLLKDLEIYLKTPELGDARLEVLGSALNSLIEVLDPEGVWTPLRPGTRT